MSGLKDALLGDTLYAERFPPFQSHSSTSMDAARSIAGRVSNLQQIVLNCIRDCPSTDEQIIATTGLNPSTARPRRLELQTLGLIRDSGRTASTASGRRATIWEAT